MTPKEKARELVNKFIDNSVVYDDGVYYYHPHPFCLAKQCALIAVDEILNLDYGSSEYYGILSSKEYWEQVKIEIEKL